MAEVDVIITGADLERIKHDNPRICIKCAIGKRRAENGAVYGNNERSLTIRGIKGPGPFKHMNNIMILEYKQSWRCDECMHTWNSPLVLFVRGRYYLIHGQEMIKLKHSHCDLDPQIHFIKYRFIEIPNTHNALLIKKGAYKLICFDRRCTQTAGGLIKFDDGTTVGIAEDGAGTIYAFNSLGHLMPFTTSIATNHPKCWLYFEIGGGENVYIYRNHYAELGPAI